jgi:hypothetical protein
VAHGHNGVSDVALCVEVSAPLHEAEVGERFESGAQLVGCVTRVALRVITA